MAVSDVLYKKRARDEECCDEECSDGEDKEGNNEDGSTDSEEEGSDEGEGLYLSQVVSDSLLPDLTPQVRDLLKKVRAIVKFFRKIFN